MYNSYLDKRIRELERRLCSGSRILLIVLEGGELKGLNHFDDVEKLKKHVELHLDERLHFVIMCKRKV